MTWELLWNIGKVIGLIMFVLAAATTIAKVWSKTSKDNLVNHLQDELKLCREHGLENDKLVLHYRDEMHAVRNECTIKIDAAVAGLEFAREKLKAVEIENARLTSMTDLSPVVERLTQFMDDHRKFTEGQTAINAQILKELKLLSERLGLNGRE